MPVRFCWPVVILGLLLGTLGLSAPSPVLAAEECGALDPSTDAGRSITCTTENYSPSAAQQGTDNIFYELPATDGDYTFTIDDDLNIRGRRSNKAQARDDNAIDTHRAPASDDPEENFKVLLAPGEPDTVIYDLNAQFGSDDTGADDPQDDHGRRNYTPPVGNPPMNVLTDPSTPVSGHPPNTRYGGVYIDTHQDFDGDIRLRSEATITVDNEPFSTNDDELRMQRREGLNPVVSGTGISVYHYGRSGDLNLTIGGTITSDGSGIRAHIDSLADKVMGSTFRDIDFTGDINIRLLQGLRIRTSLEDGHGVEAYNRGTGDITITAEETQLSATPDIETAGHDASGITAEVGGYLGMDMRDPEGGDVKVDLTNFYIRTTGGFTQRSFGGPPSDASWEGSRGLKVYSFRTGLMDIDLTGSKIETEGVRGQGIYAVYLAEGQKTGGDIDIDLETTDITTMGNYADGILAYHGSTGGVNIDVNRGRLMTEGANAHPIVGLHHGTGDVLITTRGTTITTAGAGSDGIRGGHRGDGDIEITADNTRITTAGDKADGIFAFHLGAVTVARSGTAEEGDLTRHDQADPQQTPRGGTEGPWGLFAANGATATAPPSIDITVDGGRIVANSGDGIVAKFGDAITQPGEANVMIRNGARIEAATAVRFEGGKGTLTLSNSVLTGNILFDTGSFDDQLTITQQASGQMGGIDFGDGDDMIDITVPTGQHFMFNGPIYGLNRFTQNGGGVVRFARAPYDLGENMTFNVKGGSLVVADEINLGEGELIIANAGKLVFEVSRDTTDVTWGQIFGDVRFEGDDDPSVYIQFHPDAENLDALRAGLPRLESMPSEDDSAPPPPPMIKLDLIDGTVTQGSETDNEGLMEIDLKSQPAGGGTAQTVGTVNDEGDGRFVAMIGDDGVNQIARLDVPGSLPSLTSPSTSPPPSSSGSGGGTTSAGGGGGGAPSTPTPPVDPTPTPPPSATGPRPSVGDTTTTTWFTLTVPESMMPANPAERMVSGAYGIWMNCADAVCALRQGFESHARVSEALPAVLLDLNRAPLQGEQVHHDGTGAWASLIGTSVDRDLRDSTATTSYSLAQSGVRLGYDFETSSIGTFGVSLHRQTGTAAIDHGGDIDTVVTGVRLSHRWDMTPMTVGLHATATSFASDLMSFERGSLVNDLSGSGVAVGIEANQRRTLGDATLTLGGAVTHQRVSTDGFTAHLPDANAAAGVTPVQVTDVRGRETTARLQASYHTPMTDGDWFVGGAVDLPLHRSASVAVEDTRLSAETRPSLSLQGGLAVTGATGTTTLFSLGYAQESGGERVQATLRMNF